MCHASVSASYSEMSLASYCPNFSGHQTFFSYIIFLFISYKIRVLWNTLWEVLRWSKLHSGFSITSYGYYGKLKKFFDQPNIHLRPIALKLLEPESRLHWTLRTQHCVGCPCVEVKNTAAAASVLPWFVLKRQQFIPTTAFASSMQMSMQ